jgi:hypothetical protein
VHAQKGMTFESAANLITNFSAQTENLVDKFIDSPLDLKKNYGDLNILVRALLNTSTLSSDLLLKIIKKHGANIDFQIKNSHGYNNVDISLSTYTNLKNKNGGFSYGDKRKDGLQGDNISEIFSTIYSVNRNIFDFEKIKINSYNTEVFRQYLFSDIFNTLQVFSEGYKTPADLKSFSETFSGISGSNTLTGDKSESAVLTYFDMNKLKTNNLEDVTIVYNELVSKINFFKEAYAGDENLLFNFNKSINNIKDGVLYVREMLRELREKEMAKDIDL